MPATTDADPRPERPLPGGDLVSAFLWGRAVLVGAFWYPILIGLSHLMPLSRCRGIARLAFRSFLRAAGADLRVEGLEHIDPDSTYLYMGNHVSLFDPFLFIAAVPQWVVALEKRPNFGIPVYGRLISRWGNIPVDRDDLRSALESLQTVREALERGQSICIMPEGTRSRDGEMGDFKVGPFHLAIEAKARIVPFGFRNLARFNRTGSGRLARARVDVVFTPAIDAAEYGKHEIAALSRRVRDQISEAIMAGGCGPGRHA